MQHSCFIALGIVLMIVVSSLTFMKSLSTDYTVSDTWKASAIYHCKQAKVCM